MVRFACKRTNAEHPIGVLVGLGVLLGAVPAEAACSVELVPNDAPAPWIAAASAARARVATQANDCSAIEIAVRPSGGALLTFLTADGRRAVRALMSADEVAPALDALLVTLPSEAPPPTVTAPAPSSPADEPKPDAVTSRRDAPAPVPQSTPPEVHFAIGASAGARLGFGGVYLTPAFILRPSGTFGPWELAANVELDPAYTYLPGGVQPGFRLWSFIAGVQVGRRETLGALSLGYGLGLGVAAIREEIDDVGNAKKVTDFGQPRASASGHLGLPAYGRVRPTIDLGFDAALANFKKRATDRSDVPELPRWGLVLAAGVEILAL